MPDVLLRSAHTRFLLFLFFFLFFSFLSVCMCTSYITAVFPPWIKSNLSQGSAVMLIVVVQYVLLTPSSWIL